MSNWATVALAVGPAGVTGLVGYFAARFQRDNARAETIAATQRGLLEYAERARQHRQGVYHDFLVVLDRYDAMLTNYASYDAEEFNKWLDSYNSLLRGITLFGAEVVQAEITDINRYLKSIGQEAVAEMGRTSVAFHQAQRDVYRPFRDGFNKRVFKLTAALRKDIAPEINLPALYDAIDSSKERGQPIPERDPIVAGPT